MTPYRRRNRALNWILTVLCVIAIAVLYGDAMYQHGREQAEAKCAPAMAVPKKSLYDMTPRQLRRMIRYEKAKEM